MIEQLNSSFLTEVSILFLWGFAPWYVFITWRESDRPWREAITVTIIFSLWAAWAFGAVKYNFDAPVLFGLPLRPLVYMSMLVGLTFFFRKRLIADGLSQELLIGLQLIRPIGMVFVLEQFRGTLPALFATPAGWGDLLAGITAAMVLLRYRGKPIPESAIKLVFFVGVLDFVSAFFFGFTTSASPVQIFSLDAPNQILLYPTGLIPLFLVPYAVFFHLLSWFEMVRSRENSAEMNQSIMRNRPQPRIIDA